MLLHKKGSPNTLHLHMQTSEARDPYNQKTALLPERTFTTLSVIEDENTFILFCLWETPVISQIVFHFQFALH